MHKLCSNNTVSTALALVIFQFARTGYSQDQSLLRGLNTINPPTTSSNENLSVLLRIPRSLIAKSVNRDFENTAPIQREVLGTLSRGTANCRGTVTCELIENSKGAEFGCSIAGDVISETCGSNGPAIIQARAVTNYTAYKHTMFNGRYFTTDPATVCTKTELTITGIGSTLPGLRGQLVCRIARKRAAASHDQVVAITSELTAQELRQRIDAEFDERIRLLNQKLASSLSILKHLAVTGEKLTVRSFNDSVEIGALSQSQTQSVESELVDRIPLGESIELRIRLDDNNTWDRPTVTQLLSIAPQWLASYFSSQPTLSKLNKELGIERRQNWIVLSLLE